MGQILKTKTLPHGKVLVSLELSYPEAIQLKNHTKKVHLFSENLFLHDASVIGKGAKFGAKSVTIPLGLKSRKKQKYSDIMYQKVEVDKKTFYIAVATKDPLSD